MHQVSIGRIRFFGRRSDRYSMLSAVSDQIGAPLEFPFTPRGYDLYIRLERVIGELKPHLIVSFPSRTMSDRISAFRPGDLDLPLRDHGSRKRGSQQIHALVKRIRFYRG